MIPCSDSAPPPSPLLPQSVLGDKLVMRPVCETDLSDNPRLPSPNQLKFRVLIKNKKLCADIPPLLRRVNQRTNSVVSSNASSASLNLESDDDDDDDDDELICGKFVMQLLRKFGYFFPS